MMVNREEVEQALLIEIHKSIEDTAAYTVSLLGNAKQDINLAYPPNNTLIPEEKSAMQSLVLSQIARSALTKIILDAASAPIFHLFSLMDGVADPESGDFDMWLGVTFCPKSEDVEAEDDDLMLHDKLFESYREYQKANS